MRPDSRCSGVPRTSTITIFGCILKIQMLMFFGPPYRPPNEILLILCLQNKWGGGRQRKKKQTYFFPFTDYDYDYADDDYDDDCDDAAKQTAGNWRAGESSGLHTHSASSAICPTSPNSLQLIFSFFLIFYRYFIYFYFDLCHLPTLAKSHGTNFFSCFFKTCIKSLTSIFLHWRTMAYHRQIPEKFFLHI